MTRPVATALPAVEEKPAYVRRMFAAIAPTYDLMNRLMTFGQDQRWRRLALEACDLPPHSTLLDIGTGTGDVAYAALATTPGLTAVGVDFTWEMMAAGRAKQVGLWLPFVQGDAFTLPFADATFDAVVSGFLLRNVVDRTAALREQVRVVKPGGRVVCLETAPPDNVLLGPLFRLYFFGIVPRIGALISGEGAAYRYLPQSTVDFPAPAMLRHLMELAGLRNVTYSEHLFGAVAIHSGMK
jgi:demethylmenaquinone methyltransferase/2-methoxy-6-polyprenyl-1,4-benzoquinol methylase